MDRRLNNISLLWGIPGLIVQGVGRFLLSRDGPLFWCGIVVLTIGIAALIVGLAYYAKAKARHPAWGLCGLLSCVGLLILAMLRDRSGVSLHPPTALDRYRGDDNQAPDFNFDD